MDSRKSVLKADATGWLLEEDNPSVRYFALTEFMGRAESDTDVKEAKRLIMATGIVPKILGKQKDDGYWEKAENSYIKSKYRGPRARR